MASLSVARRVRLGAFFFLCVALPIVCAQPAPTPSPSLSGCQVCATYNDCSRAYVGGPGRYCGAWEDPQTHATQRCCCPRDATCALTPNNCRCSLNATPAPTPAPPAPLSTGAWIGVGVGVAVVLSCLVGIGACIVRTATRQRNQARRPQGPATARPITSAAPMAVPVPGYSLAPGRQPYPYATAPSAPVYDYGNSYYSYDNHHDHHTGVSAGVGAVAGLATGMVIADIATDGFGGSGYHYGGSATTYDGGADAGGYVAADSGGYSGGYDGGGGGDCGGGGGDCGGDS